MEEWKTSRAPRLPVYELRKVRGHVMGEKCDHPGAAASVARRELRGLDREHILAIYVNAQKAVMGFETVSIGFENGSTATMTTLFRGAIVAGAKGIILAHNHPSGVLQPSKEDRLLLAVVTEAGKVLECPLVDFLIVTDDGKYVGKDFIEMTAESGEEDPAPIYTLVGKVRQAIEKYDRTKDHSKHDRDGDCIRCRIAAAIEGMGWVP